MNEQDICDRLMNEARRKLIDEGWTPPEPKEEFKEGDYCLFGLHKSLSKYSGKDGNFHITESSCEFAHCIHAPTWLKPETGPMPSLHKQIGTARLDEGGNAVLFLFDSTIVGHRKWFRLPLGDL